MSAANDMCLRAVIRLIRIGKRGFTSSWGCLIPAPTASEFWGLWSEVMEELKAKRNGLGPESFLAWNDGDAGFVRAIWCLVQHLRAKKVIETGVAHGVTSRFILEALERNGDGHLWSIDRPPLDPVWHEQIGIAVGGRYPASWSYVKGSSRRHLPRIISELGQIDLFIHDSLHSENNVRFEMDHAWPALRIGGAIIVDDIDANRAFHNFLERHPNHRSIICEAEPVHPDLRRFNQKGIFGIILKGSATRLDDGCAQLRAHQFWTVNIKAGCDEPNKTNAAVVDISGPRKPSVIRLGLSAGDLFRARVRSRLVSTRDRAKRVMIFGRYVFPLPRGA